MSDPLPVAGEPAAAESPDPPARLPEVAVLPAPEKPKSRTIAELFASEESGLLHFALGLVGRRSIAEEIVQEAFLRLHRVWDQVEHPKAWIYRSVHNLSLNHLRDHPAEQDLDESSGAIAADPIPAEVLGRNEAVGMVRLLLAELAPEDRHLVRLKYHDGLRYREISRRTGLSVGNVGFRLHHLLKGLADNLRRAGIEGSAG